MAAPACRLISSWVRWNLNTEQPARIGLHPVVRAPCAVVAYPLGARLSDDARCPARTDRPMNFCFTRPGTGKAGMLLPLCYAAPCCSPPALRGAAVPGLGILWRDGKICAAYTDSESFYLWLFGGKSPLFCFPGKPALQRAVAAHLEQGGISGPATESKSKTNLLAHFLLQSSRASLADVRLFYIFAALASAQEKPVRTALCFCRVWLRKPRRG